MLTRTRRSRDGGVTFESITSNSGSALVTYPFPLPHGLNRTVASGCNQRCGSVITKDAISLNDLLPWRYAFISPNRLGNDRNQPQRVKKR